MMHNNIEMINTLKRYFIKIILFFVIVLLIGGLVYIKFTQMKILKNSSQQKEDSDYLVKESSETIANLFPEDFPMYKDMELENSFVNKNEDIDGVSAIWNSNDKATDIYNFYRSELDGKGYTIKKVNEGADSYTLAFEKTNTSGFIGITENKKEGSVVTVTLGVKKSIKK